MSFFLHKKVFSQKHSNNYRQSLLYGFSSSFQECQRQGSIALALWCVQNDVFVVSGWKNEGGVYFFYKYIAICYNKKKVFFVPLHSIEKNKKPYLIFLFYETRHDCNFGPRQPREYRAC